MSLAIKYQKHDPVKSKPPSNEKKRKKQIEYKDRITPIRDKKKSNITDYNDEKMGATKLFHIDNKNDISSAPEYTPTPLHQQNTHKNFLMVLIQQGYCFII